MTIHNHIIRITTAILILLCFCCSTSFASPSGLEPDSCNPKAYPLFKKGNIHFQESQFDSALFYFNQASKEYQLAKEWENQIITLIHIGENYRVKGNYDNALNTYLQAKQIIEKEAVFKPEIQFNLLHKIGVVQIDRGNFNASLAPLQQAINLKITTQGPNDTTLALSYNSLGNAWYYSGVRDKALFYYKKALEIARTYHDSINSDVAMVYQNIGIIYAVLGDFDQAEAYFQRSLQINETILGPNSPDMGAIYMNLGRLQHLSSNNNKALLNFKRAESIFKSNFGDQHPGLGVIYMNQGTVYQSQDDIEKTLLYSKNALNILKANRAKGHPDILKLNMNIGVIYTAKRDYDKALEFFDQSLPENLNQDFVVSIYRNYAKVYSQQNNISKAKYYHNLSLAKAQELYPEDHPNIASANLSYGEFLISINDIEDCDKYLNKAHAIYIKNFGEKNMDVARAHNSLGKIDLLRGHYTNAIHHFQEAMISSVENFDSKEPAINPTKKMLPNNRTTTEALSGKAQAYLNKYLSGESEIQDLNSSLACFDLAIFLSRHIKQTFSTDESKLLFQEGDKNLFNQAIQAHLLAYKHTHEQQFLKQAFYYSEQSKSAVLLASINDVEAKELGRIPSALQTQERQLKKTIATYNRFVYEEQLKSQPAADRLTNLESKLFKLNSTYDSLVQYFESNYPRYYNLKYNQYTLPLDSLQSQLSPNEVFIEYTLSDTLLYSFYISNSSINGFETKITPDFHLAITTLRNELLAQDMGQFTKSDFDSLMRSSHQLYRTLLGPHEELFANKELIIAADDKLGYIPFEILLTQTYTGKMDFKRPAYLIKQNAISYCGSATLNYNNQNEPSDMGSRLLAFAPCYDNIANIPTEKLLAKDPKRDFLLPIPGVQQEVANIKKIFSGTAYFNQDATEQRFKQKAKDYDILHLAMHTIVADDAPMFSKLVFYNNPADTTEDCFLNTYELFNLKLKAKLAVLSACNTGSGKLRQGEGIMSLARGFIYAGVPSIVMTLWSVRDNSSAQLVERFYHYMAQGEKKNRALQKAKLDYLQNATMLTAHPHYWAAYVCIGDNTPLPEPQKTPWGLIYSGFLLIFGGGTFLLLRHRRNTTTA